MLLISTADLDDLIMDLCIRRPLGQHMLSADPFDGFAHHGCRTHVDQDIAEFSDRRIGGNAGGGIRSAALDAEEEFRSRERLLLLHGSFRGHIPRGSDSLLDRLERAAFILDPEGNNGLGRPGLDLLLQFFMRNGLAAEADDDNAVDIRVARESGQHLLAHRGIGSDIGTAGIENDIDSASDLLRNDPAGFASAGAGRQNEHMVADAGAAFRTAVSHKSEALKIRCAGRLLCTHGEGAVRQLGVIVPGHTEKVVIRDPAAGLYVGRQFSETLAVFQDMIALLQIGDSRLVTVGNIVRCRKRTYFVPLLKYDRFAFMHFRYTGHDIIRRIH